MLARALFLEPVRRSPLRFLVTVLGVAAGVAELVATLAASRAALASLREGVVEIAGRSALEITAPGGVDERTLGRLRPIARDAVILPVVEEVVLAPALDDTLKLVGVDPLVDARARDIAVANQRAAEARIDSAGGIDAPSGTQASGDANAAARWLAFLRGDGIWMATPLARRLGLGIDGELTLEIRSRAVPLRVLGLFEPPEDAPAFTSSVWIDVARAQELLGRVGRLDRIELVPRANVALEVLARRVEALLPRGARVAEPRARERETSGMVRSLEFNLTALAGISAFVGAVLVATTLATSVVQRRATIALLRSLGASQSQVLRALLWEALAIGGIGGVLGTAAGFAAARAILASMRATVAAVVAGAPPTPIRFDVEFALAGLALGIVVSTVAAILPLVEAARTPPIQALKRERPTTLSRRARAISVALAIGLALLAVELATWPAYRGLPVAALGAAICVLGVLFAIASPAIDLVGRAGSFAVPLGVLRLATAALAAGRRRAAWAAGAVSVAVALAISIATLVTSFRTTVVDWTSAGLRADFSIRPHAAQTGIPIGRLHPDVVRIARELFGTGAVDPYYTARARMNGERITFAGAAFDVASAHGGIPFRAAADGSARDGSDVLARAFRDREIVVNEAFALRFGVSEGDVVAIETGSEPLERRIAGVYFDYGDSLGVAVADEREFLAVHPGEAPRQVALFLPDADGAAARAALERELAGRFAVDILDNREVRAHVLQIFDDTFAITRALELVATIVAVIAVTSVLAALVHERRRDMALLTAIGASPAQVAACIALQAGLLGALGAALGAFAGLWIGRILVTVVNLQSFRWTLALVEPWSSLATTPALVVLACLAAALYPALRATRASLREELREEG